MADRKNDKIVMDAWIAAWEADVVKITVARKAENGLAKGGVVTQREHDLAEDPDWKGYSPSDPPLLKLPTPKP